MNPGKNSSSHFVQMRIMARLSPWYHTVNFCGLRQSYVGGGGFTVGTAMDSAKIIYKHMHDIDNFHTICCNYFRKLLVQIGNGKSKEVPSQARRGPKGSRKLRFPGFVTTAQDVGKVVGLRHRPLFTPRKYSWYSFLFEVESTSGP